MSRSEREREEDRRECTAALWQRTSEAQAPLGGEAAFRGGGAILLHWGAEGDSSSRIPLDYFKLQPGRSRHRGESVDTPAAPPQGRREPREDGGVVRTRCSAPLRPAALREEHGALCGCELRLHFDVPFVSLNEKTPEAFERPLCCLKPVVFTMARKKRTAEAAGTPAAVSRDEGSSVCANSSETNSKAASQPPPPQVGTRSAAHQRQTAPSNAALSAGNSAGGGSKSSRPSEATHGQAAVRETVVAASRSSPAADVSPSPAQQPASSPVDMEGLTPCQRRNLKKKIKQREMKQREQQRRLEEEEAQQQGGDGQSGELRCTYTPRLRDWEARLARLEAQSARAGAAAEQPSKEFSQGLSQLERDLDKALKELQEERLPQLKRPSTAPFKLRAQVASLQKTLDEKQRKLERAQERAARGLVEGDADELSREVEEARTYLAYSRRLLDSAEQFYFARDVLTRIGEMQTALRLLAKRVPKAGAAAGGGAEGAAAVASGRRAQREGVWLRRLEEMGVHVDKSALDADASALCTLQVTLPSEAVCVLFLPQGQPTLVLRQLQRRFSVVVDRIGSGTSGSQGALPVRQGAPLSLLLVSNAAENCERCRAFLAECNFVDIPGGLADAPNALQIPSNALSFIIGAGGRKIRALEEELQVLLYVESSWVVVLGEKAHVKQAIAKLQELAASAGKAPSSNRETRAASGSSSSQTQSVSLPTAVVRALAQGSLGARAALKRIEEQFGVLCTPRPPRREAESEEAVVFVRVSSANSSPASANANSAAAASSSTPSESGVSPRLAQAAAELRAFADTLRAEAIDCASQVATRVLRGDVFARLS